MYSKPTKDGEDIGLYESEASRPEKNSYTVDTDLLLWWEDYYLPVFEYVLSKMGSLQGKMVLELGTGTGGTATLLAKYGASVIGIDLLPFRLKEALNRTDKHNVGEAVDFSVMDATKLAFPDNTFDFVISKSVLVFTEHLHTAKECNRVLKPGGKAIFMENMKYHPVVWFYRKMFLKYSRELQYFSLTDIDIIGTEFEEMEHNEFHLLSLSALFWQKVVTIPVFYRWTLKFFKPIDAFLLQNIPLLKRMCWITAIICKKEG